MRQDMSKVIVERPRIGSRLPSRKKGYRKFVHNTSIDELPTREPMLGRWKGRDRYLNEHLGPMRRFLRSCVGRPWNKVHQELCEHVSFDNAVQMHVLTHVFDYVQKFVEIRGRQVVSLGGCGWSRGHVLRVGQLYVCPTSGLLKIVKTRKKRSQPRHWQRGATLQYLLKENKWWELRLQVRRNDSGDRWDVWLEKDVKQLTLEECQREYGGKLFAVSKRPLSRTEAKQLKTRMKKNAPKLSRSGY